MRKLKEVLRLKFEANLKQRAIARAVNISPSTVSHYVRAFEASDLSWPLDESIHDQALKKQLYAHCKQLKDKAPAKQAIPYETVHQALKRKGLTLQLLWDEYQELHPGRAYSYSEFCRKYRCWKKSLKTSLRQCYKAGEKCFVDYAGPKVPVIDPATGKRREAVIFIGVLGASNFTYAEATWSRQSHDWLSSHRRMFEFFGGVPELVIPDNEKAGVSDACYYDPELNPQFAALAAHYDVTILPTRPRKPQDKSKVETAVQIVERWILARLRNQQFFSLEELNSAIRQLLMCLNQKPFKKLPGTRLSQFEALEKPVLKPLPQAPYEFAEIKRAQVGLDYHVLVANHYYSVPHHLITERVEYRLTSQCVEIYYQGKQVANHLRSYEQGSHTTIPEHMPQSHRAHQQWSPQTFLHWAQHIGQATSEVAQYTITTQPHPECCYRIHLGIRNLAKRFGEKRLEQACHYALTIESPTFRTLRSILQNKLDCMPELMAANDINPAFSSSPHTHVRGAAYYQPQTHQEDE